MNNRGHVGPLLSAACLLVFAGCSVGAPPPTAVPGASGRDVRSTPKQVKTTRSWMSPAAVSQKLLYISDTATGDVEVYAYPEMTLSGQLTGFTAPAGECTNRARDVWIVTGGGPSGDSVYEYAHGGTSPVNVLPVASYVIPYSCAVNPKTGDLAVSNLNGGNVAIFRNAQGTQTTYSDPNFFTTEFVGYDPSGNLYVDGTNLYGQFLFAELPAGSSSFVDITLNATPAQPGNVQWDGKYMAVGDQGSTIYQTQGSSVVSTTTLQTSCLQQFYILPKKKNIVAPDRCAVSADVYPYPAGGAPVKTITGGLQQPFGSVLSP